MTADTLGVPGLSQCGNQREPAVRPDQDEDRQNDVGALGQKGFVQVLRFCAICRFA